MTSSEGKLFIEALFDEYSLSIKAMAKYILKNEKNAEKAVLRTFLKIVKHRKLFYGENKSDTRRLVVVFARSVCFDILRHERGIEYNRGFDVHETAETSEKHNMGDVLSELLKKEKFEWFKETFSSFGSPFKEICVLKFYYKIKTSIVADVLGLKSSEVESILGSRLLKLKMQTESYLNGSVDPSEMGVIVSLASKKCANEDCEKLDSYGISRTSVSLGTKKRILREINIIKFKFIPWGLLILILLMVIGLLFRLF